MFCLCLCLLTHSRDRRNLECANGGPICLERHKDKIRFPRIPKRGMSITEVNVKRPSSSFWHPTAVVPIIGQQRLSSRPWANPKPHLTLNLGISEDLAASSNLLTQSTGCEPIHTTQDQGSRILHAPRFENSTEQAEAHKKAPSRHKPPATLPIHSSQLYLSTGLLWYRAQQSSRSTQGRLATFQTPDF